MKQQRSTLIRDHSIAHAEIQYEEEQRNILTQSISLIEREEWALIDLSRLEDNTELAKQLHQIKTLESHQKMVPILIECLTVLNNFENTGEIDPAQAKLRQDMNTAAANLDFDKAKSLKEELEQLEREQSDKVTIGWASTSKEIARLGRILDHAELIELASLLKPPTDIEQIFERLQSEFEDLLSTAENELLSLDELKIAFGEQLRLCTKLALIFDLNPTADIGDRLSFS